MRIKTHPTYDREYFIFLRSELLDTDSPLFFHAGQSGTMKTWQVHYQYYVCTQISVFLFQVPQHSHVKEKIGERMLCPPPGEQTLKVSVATDSWINQNFKLTIGSRDNLLTPDKPNHGVQVRPSAPSYLRFNFPKENSAEKYLVKITNSRIQDLSTILTISGSRNRQNGRQILYGSLHYTIPGQCKIIKISFKVVELWSILWFNVPALLHYIVDICLLLFSGFV